MANEAGATTLFRGDERRISWYLSGSLHKMRLKMTGISVSAGRSWMLVRLKNYTGNG